MDERLHEIQIKKVLGPTNTGTAVLLGNEAKTFVMFIGIYEGAAIIRELNEETPARPLTHELFMAVLEGFEIQVKHIVISDIVNNTFCATLVLEQKCADEAGEWNGKRNEVHIDARPSDCLVIALKARQKIFATESVLERVRDITEDVQFSGLIEGSAGADDEAVDFSAAPTEAAEAGPPHLNKGIFGLKDVDVSGVEELPESFDEKDEDD